jgi:alkylation response protein AidB-like acyl-CoA dehydrogenase
MTFDLSSEQQTAREQARALAARVAPQAAEIDRKASVPDEIARDVAAVLANSARDPLATVVTIEEVAAASGAVAVVAASGIGKQGDLLNLSGLRGATTLDDSPRAQLVLAAVALGLGRAALDDALSGLRAAADTRGSSGEKPHWVVADAATELDAARLLTYKAAQSGAHGGSDTAIAMARLLASAAAQHAVDAALRIAGADGFREGSVLERLVRDVCAVALVLGTEEQMRATAAEGLLPQ